jgi:hypothetical protein
LESEGEMIIENELPVAVVLEEEDSEPVPSSGGAIPKRHVCVFCLVLLLVVGTAFAGFCGAGFCTSPQPTIKYFDCSDIKYDKPQYDGYRLDWCLTLGQGCGKPVADDFCETKGHNNATSYQIDDDIGETKVIGTGQICNISTWGRCDGFDYIACEVLCPEQKTT